jgi:uncharacterized protein with ParB-like and HNH nuclease domain
MSQFFFPQQKNVNEVFRREVSYIIPEYQRPYSWESVGKSEKNNQINIMWEDLFEAFTDNPKQLYFFGSMVLIGDDDGKEFEVVDGQQRLTSLALFFVAIRCFLSEQSEKQTNEKMRMGINSMSNRMEEILYNKNWSGVIETSKKVKIQRSVGFDFDKVLEDVFECNSVDLSKYKTETNEQVDIIKRYFDNKEFFQRALNREFIDVGIFDYEALLRLNEFIDFLLNRVFVVDIRTESFEIAYHIFEILNNRGLPLSSKDLLRNMILKEFDSLRNNSALHQDIKPFAKWQELEDTGAFDNEFLSRWVESITGSPQKKSAFSDIEEIYKTHYFDSTFHKKIESFHSDLKEYLPLYRKIIEVDFENPRLRQKVKVLLNAGNTKYSIDFLLTLLKHFNGEETQELINLVNYYERKIWHFLLVTRFYTSDVFNAISFIKSSNLSLAREILDRGEHQNDIISRSLADFFKGEIRDNQVATLAIAKYVWILESQNTDDTTTQDLDYGKCTLEHIYPQNPASGSNWLSNKFRRHDDGSFPFTYLLGNMTLITKGKNSAMRNFDFSRKKPIYGKTKLAITHALSVLSESEMEEDYIAARHYKIVNAILEDLDLGIYSYKTNGIN